MNEGHIFIDGEINEVMFQDVKRQLEANKLAQKLIVHVSSPGGSVYHGYNIYHKLKSLAIPKEAVIEGACMSIATFIVMACEKVSALNPSRYMIHLPSLGLEGTRSDLVNGAKELEMIEQEMIDAYHVKTKIPHEQIMSMMTNETYMSADEAKRYGFVDEVKQPLKAVAFGKTMKTDKTIFDNLGERLAEFTREVKAMFAPKSMELQTDKGILSIQSEDGVIEGKQAMIGGQPAPDGDYKLEDGKTVTVSGGMVTSVNEGTQPPPPEESAEDKLKKMEADLAAMKAENEQLKAAKAAEEQKAAATQQQLVATEQKVATIQGKAEALAKDFEELRKKTVGDPNPPAGPNAHVKKPAGAEEDTGSMISTKEFLKEHAPHLVGLKK